MHIDCSDLRAIRFATSFYRDIYSWRSGKKDEHGKCEKNASAKELVVNSNSNYFFDNETCLKIFIYFSCRFTIFNARFIGINHV